MERKNTFICDFSEARSQLRQLKSIVLSHNKSTKTLYFSGNISDFKLHGKTSSLFGHHLSPDLYKKNNIYWSIKSVLKLNLTSQG